MTARERLPNRRQCESFEFRHAWFGFTLCQGLYPDGRVSIALQFGVSIETIRAALTRDHDGSAATLLGAALDILAGASS